jgi:hypothetical protein
MAGGMGLRGRGGGYGIGPDRPLWPRIEPAVRSKGYGILKIARELGIGTSAVQRVLAAG